MLKNLQRNFLFCLFIAGLLFLEGPVFAQNSAQTEPTVQEVNPESAQENNQEELGPVEEHHETRDLEKLLKSYNRDQEKVLNDASKIHNIVNEESSSEISENEIENMDESFAEKKHHSKKKERTLVTKDISLSESVRISLTPLQKLSEAELLKILNDNTKDSPMRPYMDQFPNITVLAVRLIKDKESIPALVKTVENKDRLIHFAGWMLGTFILGYIIKRILHNPNRTFLGSVGMFFLRFYIMLFVRLGLIYIYFHEELKPALAVVKKTFL
jgi:hypothetical protein